MAERRRASSSRERSRLGVLLRGARRAAICTKLLRKYARSCISWGYLFYLKIGLFLHAAGAYLESLRHAFFLIGVTFPVSRASSSPTVACCRSLTGLRYMSIVIFRLW